MHLFTAVLTLEEVLDESLGGKLMYNCLCLLINSLHFIVMHTL